VRQVTIDAVKRWLVVWLLFALAAAGSVAMYQVAARERAYRGLLARGDAALRDDETFSAIEAYSGAIGLRADSMLAYLRRGEAYKRRGELETAARDLQSAAAFDATATRPLDELGDIRYEQRQFHTAAEIFERYIRLDDRAARVLYKLALARYRDGNLEGAMAALAATFRVTDRMPDAYYLQGLCFRDQRRVNEAIRAFEKACALSPGLIPAREELADLYRSLGKRGDELEQLQLIAGLDREHVEREVAVGLAHARWAADANEPSGRREGHGDLAVLTLGGVLERRPDQPLVYTALGRVWLELAESRHDSAALDKAVEALSRAGTRDGATSETLTYYGRALLQSGRTDVAEAILREAIRRFPVEASAFMYYARAAEAQRHFDTARQALLLAGALGVPAGEEVSRATQLATLSLQMADFTAAEQWFARALELRPDDLDLTAALAEAQLRAGHRDAAQTTVGRGLEKDPGNAALLALKRRL
jgi:tetratricopeptide (TPR) repeat protein